MTNEQYSLREKEYSSKKIRKLDLDPEIAIQKTHTYCSHLTETNHTNVWMKVCSILCTQLKINCKHSHKMLWHKIPLICIYVSMCTILFLVSFRARIVPFCRMFVLHSLISKFYLDIILVLLASRHEHISCCCWVTRSCSARLKTCIRKHFQQYNTIPPAACNCSILMAETVHRDIRKHTKRNLFRWENLEFCHATR